MTDDDFRELALALDGVTEGAHMGHPDFRANNRIFASLRQDDTTGMIKLLPEQQAEFLRDHPAMFTPSPGAWGRQGCTDVVLAKARVPPMRAAMQLAYELVMAKPRPKSLSRSKPGDRSKTRTATARTRRR
jgi:hypothetical protein